MALRIGLVIFPGFQMLDLAALSVFEIANLEMAMRGHEQPFYQFDIVSSQGGLIASSAGVKIDSQPIEQLEFDTLMVGGSTDIPQVGPLLISQIQQAALATRRVSSICSGAFVLADAGLLDGHSALPTGGRPRRCSSDSQKFVSIRTRSTLTRAKSGPQRE
ncbi:transcriptional activator FtrA [Ewingella americana]|uniref:Transcriptional activator FtrA n=1 Tax=Ewingella americana TaxID=41202 RepID=A0A377NC45_9GAMM|nr:transcriptional activator FtrA [Ewingella americana]